MTSPYTLTRDRCLCLYLLPTQFPPAPQRVIYAHSRTQVNTTPNRKLRRPARPPSYSSAEAAAADKMAPERNPPTPRGRQTVQARSFTSRYCHCPPPASGASRFKRKLAPTGSAELGRQGAAFTQPRCGGRVKGCREVRAANHGGRASTMRSRGTEKGPDTLPTFSCCLPSWPDSPSRRR